MRLKRALVRVWPSFVATEALRLLKNLKKQVPNYSVKHNFCMFAV